MQDLTGGPRAGLVEAEVRAALRWQTGMQARFGWDVLDQTDTETDEPLPALTGSTVGWDYRIPDDVTGAGANNQSSVRRTATLPLAGPVAINVLARRFRPFVEVRLSSGVWAKFHRGVYMSTLPPISDDGLVVSRTLDLVGKEHRYSLDELGEAKYMPEGTDVLVHVQDDLETRYGETVFDFPDGTWQLETGLAFEPTDTRLDFYNTLFGAVGLSQIYTNDEGAPGARHVDEVLVKPREWSYEPGTTQLVGGDVEALFPELPNVVIFTAAQGPTLPVEYNGQITMRNQSTGPASIDERGFPVLHRVELNVTVNPLTGNGQPALEAKARQVALRMFAGGGYQARGEVGLNPAHSDDDVVTWIKPRLELTSNAEWLVTSWADTFDATHGRTTLGLELRVNVEEGPP